MAVVCGCHDLGSSMNDLVNSISMLDAFGVRLLITSIEVDTGNGEPNGRRLVSLLRALTQFEEEVIRGRICAGMAEAQRNGRRGGRRRRAFPREVAVQMRLGGKSWRVIGRELGVPASTVRDALAGLQEGT